MKSKFFNAVNKIRYLALLVVLIFTCGNVWGADATVQLQSNLSLSNSSTFSSTTQNSVTLSGAKGGNNSNPPKYYTSGDAVRFYAKNTMTVAHASGMTKIVVNYGSKSNAISSASVGSIGSYSSNKQTWTGDATSVTFTFGGTRGNDQITSVVVTPKGGSYTVVWTINPAAGGSLSATSGTSTIVTPNSAYTYGSPAYTVTTGSASVVQSTNTFTATPSANCTIRINMVEKPKYTVTLKDDDTELTQASAGASVTLPSRAGCAGYTFAGWTKSWATAQTTWTTTAPTIISAGSYTPTANENLYPVYTKTESGGGTTTETYGFEDADVATNWTIDGPSANTSQHKTGSKAGKITTNNTYVTFKNKVKVTNFSFQFMRTSTNNNYNVYIETSTNNSTWTAVETYAMSTFTQNSWTAKSHTFDGKTELYVRFHCYNTTAERWVDDVSITYSGGSTTSYISVPNCCTSLGTINGSISLTAKNSLVEGYKSLTRNNFRVRQMLLCPIF